MEKIYANSSLRGDFFFNVFNNGKPTRVFIAVAFFTYAEPIISLANRGSRIKLLVRLGYPTSPHALRKVVGQEGIDVKYVNDSAFHPKLYIFDGQYAVVGSSNMTNSALTTNQEINVAIDAENPRFSELAEIFDDYWREAKVLSNSVLDIYEEICAKYKRQTGPKGPIESELESKLGKNGITNIQGRISKAKGKEIKLENYRATYQNFLNAYRTVERLYTAYGKRKYRLDQLPLRIEIDAWLSWISEIKAKNKSVMDEPLMVGPHLERRISAMIAEWFESASNWVDTEVVPGSFTILMQTFGTPEAIVTASYTEIVEGLKRVHSFGGRYRFFKGGQAGHVRAFMSKNEEDAVKRTLTYLLHGNADFVERMWKCISNDADNYKMQEFGPSAVQELLGWVNSDDIPICNERTNRALRYLGFDIHVKDES